jgi:hypothetical protein
MHLGVRNRENKKIGKKKKSKPKGRLFFCMTVVTPNHDYLQMFLKWSQTVSNREDWLMTDSGVRQQPRVFWENATRLDSSVNNRPTKRPAISMTPEMSEATDQR